MNRNTKTGLQAVDPRPPTVDFLENSLVTQVRFKGAAATGYKDSVHLIGGIYRSNGAPHLRSLLRRATGMQQAPELGFIPSGKEIACEARRGIYGGIISPHWGHFLLETLSRLWYLSTLKNEDIYFHPLVVPDFHHEWQRELLSRALEGNRIHFINQTTRFRRLIVPAPGYVIGRFCDERQSECLTHLGRKFGPQSRRMHGRKIWLSRSELERGKIAGEKFLEDQLSKEGFEIVHPQHLTIERQIELFQGQNVIAGFDGSAFHTALLAEPNGTRLIHFKRRGAVFPKDFEICARARKFDASFHDVFIRRGLQPTRGHFNTLHNLEKLWQILFEMNLVAEKSLSPPDLELELEKLDAQISLPDTTEKSLMRANPTAASTTNHSDENSRVNHSVRRIRALADALDARCYLEIGVAKGVTFNSLTLPEKTAVDPRFAFDIAPYEKPGVSFEQIPSDDFFSRLPRSQKFDIIFIDGLHEFEQTYRDFCNALSHASDSTVIIIDDTKPSDVFSAIPEFRASISARKAAGLPGAPWHGDVFKVVFALHDFHPTYNYRTIGGSGNPQTLVWKSNQGWRKPIFNSFERISRLSYFDLQTHIEILRECGEEEALSLCLAEIRASQIE